MQEGQRRADRRVRIKICGITRLVDGVLAARLGADAVGLVFHHKSPRAVTVEGARAMVAALPPFVTRVGLFVDAEPDAIEAVRPSMSSSSMAPSRPWPARPYGRPYLKAIRMRPELDLHAAALDYHDAAALLLDAYVEAIEGGTGRSRIQDLPKPIILAGGLTPEKRPLGCRHAERHSVRDPVRCVQRRAQAPVTGPPSPARSPIPSGSVSGVADRG